MQVHFEDLKVWQKGLRLVKDIYALTKDFPKDEMYGLTSQLRRAAVSIPVNIAEGKGRRSSKEFIQFLYTARGSAFELMTLLKIAADLGYCDAVVTKSCLDQCSEITAMLHGLIGAQK